MSTMSVIRVILPKVRASHSEIRHDARRQRLLVDGIRKDIIFGKVTTANQMGKETLDNLRNKIEQKTGKRVILHDEQNEDLIGGFILELNNLRYDASIKTSLDQIKNKLTGR